MNINTDSIVSITEANQNFSKVAKVAEKNGEAVIFKNNKPKFILFDLENSKMMRISEDEIIDKTAAEILKKFSPAFEELAK